MRRIRRCMALAAVLTLLLPAAVPKTAYGAGKIDTGETCSVEFRLTNLKEMKPEEAGGEYGNLTKGTTDALVAVHLYKVADISEYGAYTVTKRLEKEEGADDFKSALKNVGPDTDSDAWLKMAVQAAELLGVDCEKGTFPEVGNPWQEEHQKQEAANGTARFSGLNTGLYLAAAEPAQSAEYRYIFTPYLISLPDNRYYDTGSDAWIYQLTGDHAVGLKAAWEQRYAKLVIEKTLTSYNATQGVGGASFIFEITARDKTDHIVYSDVVSLQFDGTGKKETLAVEEKIPAGSKVTVEEVYSGTGYKVVGDSLKTIETIEADRTTTVSFTNEYDTGGRPDGGSSALNHFSYSGKGAGTADPGAAGGTWDFDRLKDASADSVKGGGGQ